MILLVVVVGVAAAAVLAAAVTRPIGFTLGLIQTFAFLALAFGLFGWFAVLPDPVFLWYIGGGGSLWVLTTASRSTVG